LFIAKFQVIGDSGPEYRDQEINRVQSIKHLGITYQENGKINIEERLSRNFAINNKSLKIVQLVVNLWVFVPCSKPC
jgi:hypothetical protein